MKSTDQSTSESGARKDCDDEEDEENYDSGKEKPCPLDYSDAPGLLGQRTSFVCITKRWRSLTRY